MAQLEGLSGIDLLREEALAKSVGKRFRFDTAQVWVQCLNEAEMPPVLLSFDEC